MDKSTLQEIAAIWDKISGIEKKLSDFTESRHAESVESIAALEEMEEEALCDIDLAYSERTADLEEALCELSEIMDTK